METWVNPSAPKSYFRKYTVKTFDSIRLIFLTTIILLCCLYPISSRAKLSCESIFIDKLVQPTYEYPEIGTYIGPHKLAFISIVDHYRQLKSTYQAEIYERLKTPESVHDKLLNRQDSFDREGKIFHLEDIKDVIGVRLVVPSDSILLERFYGKEDWATLLDIPKEKIFEIEEKGSFTDLKKNRFYRAIHLIIESDGGISYELQIMSKAMSYWHKWDHQHVYKGKSNRTPRYQKTLQTYSRFWAQLIRLLEDFSNAPSDKNFYTIKQLILKHGLNRQTSETRPLNLRSSDLLAHLDSSIATLLHIQPADRITNFAIHDSKGLAKIDHKKQRKFLSILSLSEKVSSFVDKKINSSAEDE